MSGTKQRGSRALIRALAANMVKSQFNFSLCFCVECGLLLAYPGKIQCAEFDNEAAIMVRGSENLRLAPAKKGL